MNELAHNSGQIGVLLLAGVLEGLGVPWPSPLIIAAIGAGLSGSTALIVLTTVFSVGYMAGSLVQYWLGRSLGHVVLGLVPPGQLKKVEQMFNRYGRGIVLWTRPLAVGNYVSAPAGMMRMPLGRFLAYTWAGIWPWALGMLLGGQLLGEQMGEITDMVAAWTPPLVLGASVLALAALGWRVWRRRVAAVRLARMARLSDAESCAD